MPLYHHVGKPGVCQLPTLISMHRRNPRKNLIYRLRRAALAFGLLLAGCMPALANPALGVVKSPTATIYLFGTVHVLPDGLQWHYPALDAALAASGTLYVEEDAQTHATMESLVTKYGLVHGETAMFQLDAKSVYPKFVYVAPAYHLSSKLDDSDKARLNAAASSAGLLGGTTRLEPMHPWLAVVALTETPVIKAGYKPQSGVGESLQSAFRAAGKPVKAFETAGQQIQLLSNLSQSLQLELLHNVLDDYAKGHARIGTLIDDWQAGNVAAIAATVNSDMREHYPELYQVLLVNRNIEWAKRIADLMQQHGTIFVAVGAGHLAGPDSVQVQLQKLGIHPERVH